MRIAGFDGFEAEVSRSAPGASFLICGTEQYQASRLRAAIRRRFEGELGFEHLSIAVEDLQSGLLARTVSSRSLFAPGRIIRLPDADRASQQLKAEIVEIIGAPREDSILVETSDTSLKSGFNARLDQHCVSYVCWEPFERDFPRWCDRLCREAGLQASGEVRSMLVAYAAGSLSRLAEAVDRCAGYLGGRRPGAAEVASLLSAAADADVFDMSDSVMEGRFERSLADCWRLLAAGEEPVGLLAFLFRQWQRAESARAMLEAGQTAAAVEKATGLPGSAARKLSGAASARRWGSAARAAESFARTDQRLKTGADPYMAMADLLESLTRP